jgi:propanol-preferring alcohol dehydrogenase
MTTPRATMRAWVVDVPGPIGSRPLRRVERPVPEPGPGQIRIAVRACGVCRTDLHVAEGDLAPHRRHVVPGHEVVGVVDQLGEGCERVAPADRVGVPWLASTCGTCRFCRRDRENLCLAPTFTGWDVDGGYADFVVADERYVYVLPDRFEDEQAAPLLCAGIIGYRALRMSGVAPGGALGIYGFGGSAHLTAQVALYEGTRVHVRTRAADARALAHEIGAASVGGSTDAVPEPLDAAILFAPAGDLVPVALAALDRGGTLAVAGIHLSEIPVLDYGRHLFNERRLVSVTANTRRDGEEFLALAAAVPVRATTAAYPMDEADTALRDLAEDRVTGAAVLLNRPIRTR